MTVFSTKGKGVCNHTFVINYPCGYPNHVGVYEDDAAEVAFSHDGNDGNPSIGKTPEITTKIGCFLAIKFTNIQTKVYDINWILGSGNRVIGNVLPYNGHIGDADFTCVFQITAVDENNKIQLQVISSDSQPRSGSINTRTINSTIIGIG
jgi:hypothetical protein